MTLLRSDNPYLGTNQEAEGLDLSLPSSPGTHRLPCPRCRKGKKDQAFAVTIDHAGGAVWLCHRCGLRGGYSGPGGRHGNQRSPSSAIADGTASVRRTERAQRLIAISRPLEGTLAERYLARRHVKAPRDHPLRFHPDAYHGPSGERAPAMVAPIVSIEDPASKPQGAHLTFLKPDGTGKADLSPPRLCLGAKKGGCIKLTPDEDVTTGLAIAEGVETALAGIRVGFPAWSCIDAGNLAAFPVLPGIEALTVIADHDQAGLDAADQVALRWHQAGREARILTPGQPGSDLNDMLMGGGNG